MLIGDIDVPRLGTSRKLVAASKKSAGALPRARLCSLEVQGEPSVCVVNGLLTLAPHFLET
jgi:hypothetical protein